MKGGERMKIRVDPKLKPLYANLLRLGIGKYLISERFEHLCIENNVDQLWDRCESYVRSLSSVAILVPGYTGDAEEALGVFLMELFRSDKERFIEVLGRILVDFAEWSDKEEDFFKVIDALLNLGYTQEKVEIILHKIKEKTVGVEYPQKSPELKTKKEQVDKTLCFVLMPFDEKFSPIYENILKKVVEEFGLKCKRADEIFGTQPIIEDIWKYIHKARILIADLTGRNPNVFYELGLAHAINKKVILITQNLKDVPFDLRHYRCIVYEDSISGADKLREGLGNTLKQELGER